MIFFVTKLKLDWRFLANSKLEKSILSSYCGTFL